MIFEDFFLVKYKVIADKKKAKFEINSIKFFYLLLGFPTAPSGILSRG